jgi:integrator complex subunit 9
MATAYSSGYSIGSCNWLIQSNMEKIAYLAASSMSAKSHVKPLDKDGLRDSDALIVSSLSSHPNLTHEEVIPKLMSTVVETLKGGGNVLFPIAPAGLVYDLIEAVYSTIEKV